MLFLFHAIDRDIQFCRAFRTRKALNRYIDNDIAMLKKEYPDERWTRKDYLIARRIK